MLAFGQGQTGFVYKVVVAGTTSIDGNAVWQLGDYIYFNGDTWDRITAGTATGAETFLELLDTPASYAGSGGYIVTVNEAENALEFTVPSAPTESSYDIVFQMEAAPTASEIIGRFGAVRGYSLPTNCSGAYAEADNAATAESVFLLKKNGVQFGTMTWAAAGTVATIASTATSFAIGDLLTWVGPGTPDDTLSGVGVTIPATLD